MKLKAKLISIMLSVLIGALGTLIAQSFVQYWVAIGFAVIFGMGTNEFLTFLKWWEETGGKK